MNLIENDFECIGQVAKHCSWSQLCIGIERAKQFDVIPLVCYDTWRMVQNSYDIWQTELETNPDAVWEYDNLWNGGEFQGCNGKWQRHLGLKKVWIYFSYAHYIIESAQKDTPTGLKKLNSDFSIPTPIKELSVIENKYRSMGFEAWEDVKHYMCANDMHDDCEDCGCGEGCDGKTKTISGITAQAVYRTKPTKEKVRYVRIGSETPTNNNNGIFDETFDPTFE